ncbi:MAG: Gfo/Idh/MocA family oxidoreductase [Bryobacterales bacterium]|nr:Gfo/Idh/MocA family oxidoreductase [Bryobacterales bacterium]
MSTTRRHFLQASGLAAAAGAPAGQASGASPSDRIRIAVIGFGGMGMGDTRYSLNVPGVQLVAVADIYDGRLTRARELFGDHIFTTRDYREVLARGDVDAVIIATPDHWHARISIEALNAGKHVYCEKPMVKDVGEGKAVIEAQRKSGKVFQVGSQYVSSLVYLKARDLIRSGALGQINMVEAWLDRNTALGAWQYSIPPDAVPANIDWDRFLGNAPKRPFEPVRLFRWRNYRDYGTAVAGDLFVHLLSGLHVATDSTGPNRIYATGGLRYWKDGRDVPDVMLALLDYPGSAGRHPEFTLALRVNFKSGVAQEQFGFRFVGSEGVMQTSMSGITLSTTGREMEPGYTIGTFSKAAQEQFLREYRRKYPERPASLETMLPEKTERYTPPRGHEAHQEHHRNFYAAIRAGRPAFEDAVFGFRAAGPALLANTSYFERRICTWDPENMTAG